MAPNQYYEGILQLRNPSKEAIKKAKDLINKRKDIWLAKEEKVTNGIDFYISSWRFMIELGNKLRKQFGGEIKTSKKLWGVNKQTSKMVYRVIFLLRLPKVKIGEIIEYRGKKVKIKEFKKKIGAADIETGKKIMINYDEV